MLKPDFGRLDRRIAWTPERIAYVRHLAEDHSMSANAIAANIGLAPDQVSRIFAICQRFDIALTGQAGRPKAAGAAVVYRVAISAHNAELLARLSKRHSLYPGKVAELLLNASFEQGEPFCENMLDLSAGA
jgi:hypothetical protein